MNKKILVIGIILLFVSVAVYPSTGNISKVISVLNSNNPPNVPSNPIPFNGTLNMSICPPNLSWSGGDPDGDNVTYDVYFGEDPFNLLLVAQDISDSWYQIPFLLDFLTTYYWKVVAEDEHGLTTSGPIWNFKTEKNYPPYPPRQPYPKDGEPYAPINVTFCWVGGDPNECDNVTYDVYFDDYYPPYKRVCNQTETCWDPPFILTPYKTYYWKVVAWDSGGLSTEGPIWTFTTGIPPLPEVEFANPREGYFHFSGVPLFKTIFNFFADTVSIGGFRLRPIQVNGTNGGPDGDPLMVWLYINGEDKGLGTWNPETEYYEWQWTGWALGTYLLEVWAENQWGLVYYTKMSVWNFCFIP